MLIYNLIQFPGLFRSKLKETRGFAECAVIKLSVIKAREIGGRTKQHRSLCVCFRSCYLALRTMENFLLTLRVVHNNARVRVFFYVAAQCTSFCECESVEAMPTAGFGRCAARRKKSIGMCIICLMALGKKAKKLKRPCNFIPGPNNGTSLFSDAAVKIFSPFTERARGENCYISLYANTNAPPFQGRWNAHPALCFFTVHEFCFASNVLIALGVRLICDRRPHGQINNQFIGICVCGPLLWCVMGKCV